MNGCCAGCGRNGGSPIRDGFCPSCDVALFAQAKEGILLIEDYLAKVAQFQVWCAEHERSVA